MRGKEMTRGKSYRIRLGKGEHIFDSLGAFCKSEKVVHADICAIGAIEGARIGAYLLSEKKYVETQYGGVWEVCSLTGNVSIVNDVPFIHAHIVISDEHNNTVGGHLFGGVVGVTLEVSLTAYSEPLARVLDDTIGLSLLDL